MTQQQLVTGPKLQGTHSRCSSSNNSEGNNTRSKPATDAIPPGATNETTNTVESDSDLSDGALDVKP
ncbi:hypothetical protein cyc_04020 [Cyclospora cayetanensis]|nr:hypothetical protein cyc_04020 [Cyclospora cayetanensis]